MLVEMRSSVLRKEDKTITFKKGLNIVIGPGNSIGKTSLLKMIDCCFGGSYYHDTKTDIVDHVGNHEIDFCYDFNEKFYFKRSTCKVNTVFKCNEKYEIQTEITLKEFNSFLEEKYQIKLGDISFRDLIGQYIRVWNKANKEVNRPLFYYSGETKQKSIYKLIDTFGVSDGIWDLKNEYELMQGKSKAYKYAKEYNIISSSMSSNEYKKNFDRISEIDTMLEKILKEYDFRKQNNVTLQEDKTNEDLSLRATLLRERSKRKQELKRIMNNIQMQSNTNNNSFMELIEYFPEVNIEKLTKINKFHNCISDILRTDLHQAKKEIEQRIEDINNDVVHLEQNIFKSELEEKEVKEFKKYNELLIEKEKLMNCNNYYEDIKALPKRKTESQKKLNAQMAEIVIFVQNQINNQIEEFSSKILSSNNKPPHFKLKTNSYEYSTPNNTGTGKAYLDLVLFDLSVLKLTQLPIVIHDSFIFNHMDNNTVSSIIRIYKSFNHKQTFISADKMYDFDKEINEIMLNCGIVFLGDESTLYNKDWRN